MPEPVEPTAAPTVLGDVWSGLPHYACAVCGWDTMDVAALTEHLRVAHPVALTPAEPPDEDAPPEDAPAEEPEPPEEPEEVTV